LQIVGRKEGAAHCPADAEDARRKADHISPLGRFADLAVVLDAYSRAIGRALAEHLRAELALGALRMALATRADPPL
jgi:hypothetical protein